MRSLRIMIAAAAGVFAIPALAGSAQAHPGFGIPGGTAAAQCVVGCNMQSKGCVESARTAALACKETCRAASDTSTHWSCLRGCATTFGSSLGTCHAGQVDCIEGCFPSATPPPRPTPPPVINCLGTCGKDLATCAQGVIAQAKTCAGNCRTPADRFPCLLACAGGTRTGGEACGTAFDACKKACVTP